MIPFLASAFLKKHILLKEKKIDFKSSFKKKTIWNDLYNNNVTIINIGLDRLIINSHSLHRISMQSPI